MSLINRAQVLLNEMGESVESQVDELLEVEPGLVSPRSKNNTITFHRLKRVYGPKTERLLIARSRPRQMDSKQDAQRSYKIMHEKGVLPDFHQFPLYYNRRGDRFFPKANCSLSDFFQRYQQRISWQTFQEIIGQIILAVHDLHIHDLVHRDIKPENILIFYYAGRYHVKFCDHDNVFDIHHSERSIVGTPELLSPELKAIHLYTEQKNSDHSVTARALFQLDLKKVDSYALGKTIEEARDALLTPKSKRNNEGGLQRLINGLKRDERTDPKRRSRWSVTQAMQCSVFGRDKETRNEAFFGPLREFAQSKVIKVDGHEHRPVALGNPFYFLDTRIKPIYLAGEKIKNIGKSLEECNAIIEQKCMGKKVKKIGLAFKPLDDIRELNGMVRDANKRTAEYKNFKEIKRQAKQEVEETFAALLASPEAITRLLNKVVNETYKNYVKINQLEDAEGNPLKTSCWNRLFSRHNARGRILARQLKASMSLAIIGKKDPREIFDVIYNHLEKAGGNWNEHSFNTMLVQKLGLISDRSMDQWKADFERAYPATQASLQPGR